MPAPIPPHAMPYRAWFRHISGDFNPSDCGNRLHAGTCTSCNDNPDVTDARNDHLPCTSSALNPLRSVSTINPRTLSFSSSTFAQTTATSAIEPDVIHIFSPFSTYSLPCFSARVRMPPGFEPYPGSVSPKHPIFSPLASAGNHFCFCSSLPNRSEEHTSELQPHSFISY